MGKTIAINAGSSSLKWKLYDMPSEHVLASGVVERIGLPGSIFSVSMAGKKVSEELMTISSHELAIEIVLKELTARGIIHSIDEITGVGHRVVAGGEIFKDSVRVDDEVIQQIEDLSEFAPLHNPANAMGIRAFRHILPSVPSVAVFDTSFHQTIPPVNYMYSLPISYYKKYNARRYGAHGTSHRYVSQRAAELLGRPLSELKIVSAHLGNGASVTAIKDGQSYHTSMGFTPLSGLTMGTRSGDLDPSLLPFLMKKEEILDIEEMIHILNTESGLKGLSGVSSDMRELQAAATGGNEQAQLALDVFDNRVISYIGQYATLMEGLDVLIFTAGIGENDSDRRQKITEGLRLFGAELDVEKNKVRGVEQLLSTADSEVDVLLIPTDEELMIARDVERLK